MMRQRSVLFAVLTALSLCASLAHAGVIYSISVDTSSIAGTAGSLDFNFDPGPLITEAASLQILSFTSDGALATGPCASGGPCLTGDVSGTLPGTVTFDNGSGFNDYFAGFTYGTKLSFDVDLSGPALTSPGGTSGSTFAFSMFSDGAGTVPVLTSDTVNGFAVTLNVNTDGTITVADSSSQTTVVPAASNVPEPGSLALLGTALALGGASRLRRTARRERLRKFS